MDARPDQDWLLKLDLDSAVLVPTRGLLSHLNEQYAAAKIAQGAEVWEAPQLLVWSDYLNLLWQLNRHQLATQQGVLNLISSQQSTLLWTQVVEQSRRDEQALTLLNVQQTVVAVQRSWRLLHDWQINPERLAHDHVADTEQFMLWLEQYQALLSKRGLVDEPWLLTKLLALDELQLPFKNLLWRDYDLITDGQQALNQRAQSMGVQVSLQSRKPPKQPRIEYKVYPQVNDEIRHTLLRARRLLEHDPTHTINIVIPDLSQRLPSVREMAREVFYPASSPLQVQQNNSVYRFSLGEPLSDWAAIETALCLIKLLQNRLSVIDLSFLLRNQFLAVMVNHARSAQLFDRWLKRQRLHTVSVDNLANLQAQCMLDLPSQNDAKPHQEFAQALIHIVELRQQLSAQLDAAKTQQQFAALSFDSWVGVFDQWLQAWGWHTSSAGVELNSVQHQLHQRWQKLLQEYAGLALVQRQAGIKRAFDVLQQMARDTMFLPKSVNSPILISSLLEAIGRPVDSLFLTGMTDAFPPAPRNDAFVPNRLLANTGNPNASAQASFSQAERVNQSVLAQALTQVISYAYLSDQDRDVRNHPSPLYRHQQFDEAELPTLLIADAELHQYQDNYGPEWDEPGRAKGGSRIFENQSNCAFKAFVSHQLNFDQGDEAEFGLDAMDRGNVVHQLMDMLWKQLDNQAALLAKTPAQLETLIDAVIEQGLQHFKSKLSDDKFTLLRHERPRLQRLLTRWLEFESARPQNFTVLEREMENITDYAGIRFKLVIDRIDVSDDGRTFVIDYKTGTAARKDWLGERMARPQLPLYAVALDAQKQKNVSGIAIAKVDAVKPEFIELAEGDVFRKGARYESEWQDNRPQWETLFSDLAEQFLSGYAEVNPIDEKTCEYCELHAVCRVSQLRAQTVANDEAKQ